MTAEGNSARAAAASSMVATKKVLQPALASARATGARPQPYALALMTAEHSAGTAVFSSLRQLATRASRSTVRTPLAADSAAALLASDERTESAGSDFGSGAMFIRYFRRANAAVQPDRFPALVGPVRHLVVRRQIAEPGYAAFKLQLDRTGWTVALLTDDHLGLAVHQ